MPWAAGTYTKGNNATGGWAGDAAVNIGIEAGRHDTQDNDFATGINQCLNKDGSNAATGNLNLGTNKITNLGAPTSANDAATKTYIDTLVGPVTAAGRALIDDADAAAQRTTLGLGTLATQAGTAVTSLNGITGQATQTFAVGTSGTNFAINSSGTTHTFNIPDASSSNRGLVTTGNQNFAGIKNFVDPWTINTLNGNVVEYYSYFNGSNHAQIAFGKSQSGVIGTSAALNNGDAIGTILFRPNNGSTFILSGADFSCLANGAQSSTSTPTRLRWSTTPSGTTSMVERMTVLENGNFGINTTTPSHRCHVVSNANTIHPGFFASTASGDVGRASLLCRKFDNDSTTSQIFVRFEINNTTTGSGQINANGASQAAFGSYSDISLKENVVDLPSMLGAINALRPVEFDYKDGSGHQIGFIAQEVASVFPDLVSADEEGLLMLSGLGKGEARLIKAIQELSAKIEELKARVEVLEA
jgi:hypothetical protein